MNRTTVFGGCTLALALASGMAHAQEGPSLVAPAPPLAASPLRSATELEKLAAPIALYPDPLIATILPAAVYPLEIVQAARFVSNTNNLPRLDEQPWDENVKALARVPAALGKLNDDLAWTAELGQAFLEQPQEVLDTVQALRAKARVLGTLKTTPQQVVFVTNTVVEKTIEQQIVVVTNTIVQIQPSNPQVVYVPAYDPWYVYYPPPVYYVGPPPVVTFAAGIAVGAIIANNCDWHGGGIYVGHHGVAVWGGGGYHGDVDIDINRNVNIHKNEFNVNKVNLQSQGQKWQPDQSRLRTAGAPGAAKSFEARGWSSPSGRRPASTSALGSGRTTTSSALSQTRPASSASASYSAPSRAATATANNVGGGLSSRTRESAFGGLSNGARDRSSSQRGSFSRRGGAGGRSFGGGRR